MADPNPVAPGKIFDAVVALQWAAFGGGMFLTVFGSILAYLRNESPMGLIMLAVPLAFGTGALANWLNKS